MSDEVDTNRNIFEFAKANISVQELKFIVDDPNDLEIIPLASDGMINYIYRILSSDGKKSVILKYGEDRVRVRFGSGDDVPLKRQEVEYEALKLLHDLQPGCVPQPFCFDRQYRIVAMEDLSEMHLLYDDLIQGKVDANIAAQLGQMMAKLHMSTYKEHVTPGKWESLKQKFSNRDIKDLIISYRMIRAFKESDSFNDIHPDCLKTYQNCMLEIDACGVLPKLLDLYNMELCVCHVDIHSKSVFVKDSKFAVFDCEWATLSHPTIDIAYALTWYIYSMMKMRDHPQIDQHHNTSRIKEAVLAMDLYFSDLAPDYGPFATGAMKLFDVMLKSRGICRVLYKLLATSDLVRGYFEMCDKYKHFPGTRATFWSQISAFMGAYLFAHANFSNIECAFAKFTPDRKNIVVELGCKLMTGYLTQPVMDIDTFVNNLFSSE